MSIIFDLDDTLIDTSGSIMPGAFAWVLEQLQVEMDVKKLLECNRSAQNGRQALYSFFETNGALGHYENACRLLDEAPLDSAMPVPGAMEAVNSLPHRMAIVTVGIQNRQIKKLNVAGFDLNRFSAIRVVDKPVKGPIYAELMKKWGESPEKILVVGDRVATDLQPAKALGMRTVHVRWGRGQNMTGLKRDIDYIIDALTQLQPIAYEHENKNNK